MENSSSSSSSSSSRVCRDGKDIISSLPDTMLLEILSFLDMKHAVQTTILSKRWTDLWTSLGNLTFDTQLFYSPTERSFVGFHNFVDQVLLLRENSDINTFRLTSRRKGCEIIKSRLHTWILSVIRSKVRTLYIDVVLGDGKWLPNSLFTCNTLTILTLKIYDNERWSITLPANSSMCLPNLKELRLRSISFHDEYLTNKFFLSCPNLDGLVLVDVEFLHMNVNISALKLTYLIVNNLRHKVLGYNRWPDSKFKLHAPDLSYFTCQDFMSKDYIMGNLPSLVVANIDMKLEVEDQNRELIYSKLPVEKKQMYAQRMMQCLRALVSVEDLNLSAWFLEVVSGSIDLFKSEPTELCDLICLSLQTWLSVDTIRAIMYLLNISPNVESLFLKISKTKFGTSIIGENPDADMSLQDVLYELELVEIRGAVGCVNELKFLEIMLKNAKILKKLVIYTSKEDSPDRERRMMKFTEKLLTFPKASSDITISFF